MSPNRCQSFIVHYCLVLALLLLSAHCSLLTVGAQSATATLSGTVIDANGAVVPGAKVTVTNPATGLQRQANANEHGSFTIPLLPPSTYTVSVEGQGFAPVEVRDVELNVGDQKALQIQLKAGNINATVQVVDEAPLIDQSSAVGTVVDRQFAGNIPLNGRSFQSLITLTPGVVLVPAVGNTGQFSVNGQRTDANYFTIDGVSANISNGAGLAVGAPTSGSLPGFTALGTTQSLVSVDALQEFRVQTSTYGAEFGRQPGGQISIVTRSGNNEFHGSAFDYIRNDKFDANNWFNNANRIARQVERQNDFGGTFSGPILLPRFGNGGRQPGYNGRNRTFFFFSYEGLRLSTPQFVLTAVPSLAFRQTAPAAMQPLLNAFPLPNGPDVGGGFSQLAAGFSNPSTLNATSLRIDHTINQKLTLFGRFNNAPSQAATRRPNLAELSFTSINTRTLTAGATMTFSPRTSNELRANYSSNRGTFGIEQDNFGGAVPVPRELLLPLQYAPAGSSAEGLARFFFPGGNATVDVNASEQSQRQFNLVDNFSLVLGPHRLKFGADYRRLMPILAPRAYILSASFLTQTDVINSKASSGSIFAEKGAKPIYTNFSAYMQDTWKPLRRLTLDLGVRWDLNPPPGEANGNVPYTVNGLSNLATMTLAPQGTKLWQTTRVNFAPRFGAAYLVRQAQGHETLVRGGFGVFYDTGNNNGSAAFDNYPFSFSRSVSISFPLDPTQLAPPPFTVSPPFGTLIVFDPNLKLPYTLQWSVGVEQSLGKAQVLTLTYIGNAGRRLLQTRSLRLGTNFTKINPNFTIVNLTTNKATSDYDALQAQFQRRLSRGLQVLASYTWSHALDEDSVDNGIIIPVRGNASFDVRHSLASAVTYDIPKPGDDRFLNALLGYWSMDTSVHVQSAAPVDITGATIINPADGTLIAARANLITGVPLYIYDPSVPGGRKINRAAFSAPAAGQFGNLGRNVVRGFGSWQVDVSIRRQFKLTEKVKLQFRAEAFNIFNHPNFGSISTTLTSTTFGQATNMLGTQLGGLSPLYQIGGPRSFQFALKLQF